MAGVIAKCQTYTQTFIDKCTGKTVTATTQYINGNAVVSFYNQIKTFTPQQVQSGLLQAWLQATYTSYSTSTCPLSTTTTSIVTQAASSAASSAAASAASSAASSTASSTASSSVSSSTPSPAPSSGGDQSSTNTSSSNNSSSNNSSSQSDNKSSSDNKTSSDSKSDDSKQSDSKTESKSDDNKQSESKSESKSEEKKSDTKSDEKKKEEEKKKKEEEKKKKQEQRKLNPMVLTANLGGGEQTPNRKVVPTINMGISKSSMTGMSSYGINATLFLDLSKVSIGASYTKSEVNWMGQLNAVHNFGFTYFTDFKTQMVFPAYTYIQPLGRLMTGYNISANTTMTQDKSFSIAPSIISFAMYPFTVRRQTLTPDLFIITSPYNYSFQTQTATRSSTLTFMTGVSSDLKITRRFKLNTSAHITIGTDGGKYMRSFAIGSHVNL